MKQFQSFFFPECQILLYGVHQDWRIVLGWKHRHYRSCYALQLSLSSLLVSPCVFRIQTHIKICTQMTVVVSPLGKLPVGIHSGQEPWWLATVWHRVEHWGCRWWKQLTPSPCWEARERGLPLACRTWRRDADPLPCQSLLLSLIKDILIAERYSLTHSYHHM